MDSLFDILLGKSLSGGGGGGGGTSNYNALENKPSINSVTLTGNKSLSDLGIAAASDIPTVNNGTLTIQKNGTKIDEFKANQSANTTINITVPTTASDVSALPNTTKYAAALSLTINSSTYVVTGQLKDQNGDNLGSAQTIDLPLETMVVGGSYDDEHKKIVLTLKNGNTVDIPVADLVSGLQTELSATNKLDPAFIDYDSTHAAVTESEKTTWSGKQDALTFDGTYSSSTNKAATVSTVTNAIGALDVTGESSIAASKTIKAWSETDGKVSVTTQDISISASQAGLGNVTNDAQVKKISSSTTGNIVTWNAATGDTVADSGVSIETNTNFSASSDTKIPTSKSIATNVAANAVLTGYSVDASRSNITAASTVRDAIEQLEYREETNKTNILSLYNQNGKTFNLFDINRPIDVAYHATGVVANNAITIGSVSGDWAYVGIKVLNLPAGSYRVSGKISNLVTGAAGSTRIVVSQYSSASQGSLIYVNITQNGDFSGGFIWTGGDIYLLFYVNNSSSSSVNYTYTASDLQIISTSAYNAGFTDYQPYALPNTAITPALVECVDNGKKQLLQFHSDTSGALVATAQSNGYSVLITGGDDAVGKTVAYAECTIEKTGAYTFACNLSGTGASCYVYDATTSTQIREYYATSAETLTLTGGHTYQIRTYRKGSGTNATVEAMICEKSLYDVSPTFVPYSLSNAELTDNTQIIEITSSITAASGFTKSSTTHVYKQGKHIFGTLVFQKSSGSYPTTGGDVVGTMGNYAPVAQWLGCGFFSDSLWTLQTCGYAFIQNAYGQGDAGQIIVTDGAGGTNNVVKIQIDYVMP